MDFVKETQGAMRLSVSKLHTAADCLVLQDQTQGSTTTCIGPFVVDYQLNCQQRTILDRLASFYTPEIIEDVLVPALTHGNGSCSGKESNPSLRVLDWCVVNYAKKTKLTTRTIDGKIFNVYHGYRVALNHYRRRVATFRLPARMSPSFSPSFSLPSPSPSASALSTLTHERMMGARRRLFDPFRRRLRLIVKHDETGDMKSTIGQLQFLCWAYQNGVLQFARENASFIEADMNATTARSKALRIEARKRGVKTKRSELTKACATQVVVHEAGMNFAM